MVRRRGIYEVTIIGKPLVCLFCGGRKFRHREAYVKVNEIGHEPGMPRKKLTLQTFNCTVCSHELRFEEQKKDGCSSIEYVEVAE